MAAVGTTVQLELTYTPVDAGADIGTLVIASNDLDEPTVSVDLTGTGVMPEIEVSFVSLDYGDVEVGSSLIFPVTIANIGTAPLTVSSIEFAVGNSEEFSITNSPALPAEVAVGSTVQLELTYTPVDAGTDSGTLVIASNDSDEPTLSLDLTGTGVVLEIVEVGVDRDSDDAEEYDSGMVELTSIDLDFAQRIVGVRFNGMDIPPGATILDAYVELTSRQFRKKPTSIDIQGEAVDNSETFSSSSWSISSRSTTVASMNWILAVWDEGERYQSPDITSIIQEIVDRPGWANGNSLGLIFEMGTGKRAARSYDISPTEAPRLHVEYVSAPPVNQAPSVDVGPDLSIALPASARLDSTVTDDGLSAPPGAVTLTWSLASGPDTVSFGDPSAQDTTATFYQEGPYILRLTVDDGELSTSDDLTITVSPEGTNQLPLVDAGPPRTVVFPDMVTMDGWVTDDGLPNPPGNVSTTWTKENGPGMVMFSDVGILNPTLRFSETGVYLLKLEADDGQFTTTDTVSVTVQDGALGPGQVSAIVETDATRSGGDGADDPCIWIHPTDPALSLIIGTDKGSGLGIYDVATGTEMQFLSLGRMNNVDIRYNFPLGGDQFALVAASNRSDNTIALFKVNPATRQLQSVGSVAAGIGVYGFCLYHSPISGLYYAFVNSRRGLVEQYELFDDGTGSVGGTLVRTFDVGSKTEGCVSDDEYAHLYIGQENVGIWRYGAEPDAGFSRVQVDTTGSGGNLSADVEGLSIYYASNGTGYLIASSQGSNEFVIYQRQGNNEFVTTFRVIDDGGVDGVSRTDGIDVVNFPLGPAFPWGVFVAHDGSNNNNNQNYKLVPWERVANAVSPPLTIDTARDPRRVGMLSINE